MLDLQEAKRLSSDLAAISAHASSSGIIQLPQAGRRTNLLVGISHQISDQAATRHALAEHNVLGVLNGDPAKKDTFGLTDRGRAEVALLIPLLARWIEVADKPLQIVHSDFRRAREMADILYAALRCNICGREERVELRERNPGNLEGLPYRKVLAKFGLHSNEEESEKPTRGQLKRSLIKLLHRSNILAFPSERILGLEPVGVVEHRMTSLIREMHSRQQQTPMLVFYIGHEFSLGEALNAFLLSRPPGMFWTNRHIPRAKPFLLSVQTAQRHFLQEAPIQPLPLLRAA